MEAIRNLKEGAQHAETEEYYPLCFLHFAPWFREVLTPQSIGAGTIYML